MTLKSETLFIIKPTKMEIQEKNLIRFLSSHSRTRTFNLQSDRLFYSADVIELLVEEANKIAFQQLRTVIYPYWKRT